jgi:hypothetical protein
MSYIYNDDSLQNDPNWKRFEHKANMGMHNYHMKNFKPQCDAPRGATVSDGYVMPPCAIDTDSMLRHGLIENPSLIEPEEVDKTHFHFNTMPAHYQQQCELRDVQCARKPDFKFWEATSASVNPQENIHVFDYQGVGTRHWGRKSDNFYKNLDDVQFKPLF